LVSLYRIVGDPFFLLSCVLILIISFSQSFKAKLQLVVRENKLLKNLFILSGVIKVKSMSEKVKTSLFINRALWEEFKLKVGSRVGLRALSKAVEELLEDEVAELVVADELSKMVETSSLIEVKPVKPKVPTDASKAIRELRERENEKPNSVP